MKLTIFIDVARGGLADYAHAQANALVARGIKVKMLCTQEFLERSDIAYCAEPCLDDWRRNSDARLPKVRRACSLVGNFRKLADSVSTERCDAVLTHFSEYLSPFWAPRLRRLNDSGIVFATVLHDPKRDYQLGPRWWHELSVREAFSFFDLVLTHTHDPISVPSNAVVKWIPHGLFAFPEPIKPRDAVRNALGVPEAALLALSFGYLRDNKNLDLGIEAVSRTPGVHLLVAGRDQSQRNKPQAFYENLAKQLGCADRVHWQSGFISEEETANLMAASDVLLLTYSQSFVSWSGVLSLAARYHLPAIVSSGANTMGALAEQFRTGVSVEPDSIVAIQKALANWAKQDGNRDWDGYQAEMSWDRNAELVEAYISELKGWG